MNVLKALLGACHARGAPGQGCTAELEITVMCRGKKHQAGVSFGTSDMGMGAGGLQPRPWLSQPGWVMQGGSAGWAGGTRLGVLVLSEAELF